MCVSYFDLVQLYGFGARGAIRDPVTLSKPLRSLLQKGCRAATGAPDCSVSGGQPQLHDLTSGLHLARRTTGVGLVSSSCTCTALVACLPRPRWIIPWPGTRSVHTRCPSLHGWMEYKVNRHKHSGLQSTPAQGTACHSMTRSSAPSIHRSHPRITPRVTQAPDPCRRTCRPPRRQPRTHVCCLCHRTHPRLCLKVNLHIGPTACKLTVPLPFADVAFCREQRPFLPANLKNAEREQTLGMRMDCVDMKSLECGSSEPCTGAHRPSTQYEPWALGPQARGSYP